jgi:CDGSH iron-sulfur domain-containing protein 3
MTQPTDRSAKLSLEAGTHWLCTCGQSKNYPHCDGGHKGSPFQPLALELSSPKIVEISQ